MKVLNEETHPAWYIDIPVMKTLILGSFPPNEIRWTYPFYYPNAQNRFWYILSEICGLPLNYTKTDKAKAVEERIAIMKKLQIGIQNVGMKIQRVGTSARDTDITITTFQDILQIIREHPELERILLPGFSAKNSTFWSFIAYLKHQNINTDSIGKPSVHHTFEIDIDGRKIECVVLNSTSTATSISFNTVLEQFRKYI